MTVQIELLREDALSVLRYLEKLNVLKVLKTDKEIPMNEANKKSRFAGRISADKAKMLQEQLQQMR